jgi:hypothetical protein
MKLEFCCVCGDTEDLHQHHILPVVSSNKKRDTKNDETVTLCTKHHLQIHEKVHTGGYKHKSLVVQGLQRAKENGVKLGRPTTLTDELILQVVDMSEAGIGVRHTCRTLKIGSATYYKIIREEHNKLIKKKEEETNTLIRALNRFSSPEKNSGNRKT